MLTSPASSSGGGGSPSAAASLRPPVVVTRVGSSSSPLARSSTSSEASEPFTPRGYSPGGSVSHSGFSQLTDWGLPLALEWEMTGAVERSRVCTGAPVIFRSHLSIPLFTNTHRGHPRALRERPGSTVQNPLDCGSVDAGMQACSPLASTTIMGRLIEDEGGCLQAPGFRIAQWLVENDLRLLSLKDWPQVPACSLLTKIVGPSWLAVTSSRGTAFRLIPLHHECPDTIRI